MAEIGKPGINWIQVGPEARRKIAPIVRHYMRKAHPFTACVRDNTKRFGRERAERVCAVVKDMGMRTTKWRGKRKGKLTESPADDEAFIAELFDEVWAPVLEREGVTVEELADWSRMAQDAGILEMRVETGDLGALVETRANPGVTRWGTPMRPENMPGNRRPGSSGSRSSGARTRRRGSAASNPQFEREHPRGRDGRWVLKQGSTGEEVRVVQRRLGVQADGRFGALTRRAVMDFQRRHGLRVDGIVGRQTIAALRGDRNAQRVAPGAATRQDVQWLRARVRAASRSRRVREAFMVPATSGPLALRIGEDGRLVREPKNDDGGGDGGEPVWDLRVQEAAPLTLIERVDGKRVPRDVELVEAAGDAFFNEDGTIDFVIIRPCHGRGPANAIYEASMLAANAHVFKGLPVFDNHESPDAKRARRWLPRPPSELAGEIVDSWWDPDFTTPHDAERGFDKGAVIGRFALTEDMERLVRRLPRAVKTSVNVEATRMRPVVRNGKRGNLVEGLVADPERHSVDLVTRAGAGGEVAALYREMVPA